ncbi:MAG: carboxypeptidase-like regulatory domain-containing protein, partial [Planctomycetota bacterium]
VAVTRAPQKQEATPSEAQNPAGTLRGFLHGLGGVRLPHHSIHLRGETSAVAAHSDETGAFVFDSVPPGRYFLAVRNSSKLFPARVLSSQQVWVRSGETTFVDVFPAERTLRAELLLENYDRLDTNRQGERHAQILLTPVQSVGAPQLEARFPLRTASELRAEIQRRGADEELNQVPHEHVALRGELDRLSESLAHTADPWRPLHFAGLGSALYRGRIELGEVALPNGTVETVFSEFLVDLTQTDVLDLRIEIDHQREIEQAVARAELR